MGLYIQYFHIWWKHYALLESKTEIDVLIFIFHLSCEVLEKQALGFKKGIQKSKMMERIETKGEREERKWVTEAL